MFSLLRADMRRILRRHGGFYGFAIVIVALCLVMGVAVELLSRLGAEAGVDTGITPYASPVDCVVGMLGDLLALVICLSAVRVCWIDKRNGYDRTIVSSCGKRTYYHEKILFALVLTVVFALFALAATSVTGLLVRGISGLDSPLVFVEWFAPTVLVAWTCACLSMAGLWLTGSQILGIVLAFFLTNGMIAGAIGMAVGGVNADVAQVYYAVCEWLPNAAVTLSANAVNGAFVFAQEGLARMAVPTVACLALTFVCVGVLRKRDL
ncbi:hypothetical protein [Paratractidigestivibacter sp.]|uniref:hypothetical protein n=1 Tax=Paratractidigestivibacter sp. TaxID=2847316 RepID=UPI002AC89C80|nr:hypothetical protein [Paratractidigestivibacter sp.]